MVKAYIRLDTLDDISRLHNAAKDCQFDLVLESGAIRVNPKSLLGIFGIGTKKTAALVTRNGDKKMFLEKFGDFIA